MPASAPHGTVSARTGPWAAAALLAALGVATAPAQASAAADREPPALNVLWITVDDMSADSVGVYGCPLPGTTPSIDRLASTGLRFERGHVSVAICQPTRAVWMTGRYPHRSGALGFDRIRPDVPTLVEAVHAAGWTTGLLGKTRHVVPSRHAAFDTIVERRELGEGRDPEAYAERAAAFFERAAAAGKPFFLMANAHDPHRPFATSRQEARANRRSTTRRGRARYPAAERAYDPVEVPVPPSLPELPEVRLELAEYFTSVRRADRTVGALLEALERSGAADRTLVVFLSDHGMPLPFHKTNCWRLSTRTPWIVRWPGVTRPGAVDATHFVSGIDLAPTVLDALGLAPLPDADGRSFVPLLRGEEVADRDAVLTCIHTLSSGREYAMRAIHTADWSYVWNPWSDGERTFRNESMSGRTFRAMQEAAPGDPALAERLDLWLRRRPEELYAASDPYSLEDLHADEAARPHLERLRRRMARWLAETEDPLAECFAAGPGRGGWR